MGEDAGERAAERRGDRPAARVRRDAAAALADIDLDQRAELPGCAAMARGASTSSVMTFTSAPCAFSAATASSFCGVMPTA